MSEIKIVPLLNTIEFRDISDSEYFSSSYKKYISNSSLTLINPEQGGSPQAYKEGLSARYIDSMVFGSAVHAFVLQPEQHILTDIDRPTAKLGFMADELYPSYCVGQYIIDQDVVTASDKIDYYKGKMDEKKISAVKEKCSDYWERRFQFERQNSDKTPVYLDAKSRIKLSECLESVKNNKEIQELLHPTGFSNDPESRNEICVIMDVEAIFPDGESLILPLKAKIDNYTVDKETNTIVLNDLKTTGHLIEDFIGSFYKFHYYRQMGMYGWMLRMASNVLGVENPTMQANMLLISTVPNYRSGVFTVLNSHIKRGVEEFSELIKRVAYHERYGYDIEQPEL